MSKHKIVLALGLLISFFACVGLAQAMQVFSDAISVPSLKVGAQGIGGVTFFNGTIINETTNNGADNPVTFGDNVRIDGAIFRTEVGGSNPLKISDSLRPTTTAVYSLGESSYRFKDAYLSGTLTAGTIAASALSGSGIVSSDNLASGAVTSGKIANGTIATADLADSSITSAKITDATIATADLADSSITNAKITDGTIAAADLADESITSSKIPAGAITQSSQDYGEGTADTTTEVIIDSIQNTEVALTTTGGTVFVSFSGVFSNNTANGQTRTWLVVDGNHVAAPHTIRRGHSASADTTFTLAYTALITNLAAGSHTFTVGWNTDSGTTSSVYNHTLDVIELKK